MSTTKNIVIPCGSAVRIRMKRNADRLSLSVAGLGRLMLDYGLDKLESGELTFQPSKIEDSPVQGEPKP